MFYTTHSYALITNKTADMAVYVETVIKASNLYQILIILSRFQNRLKAFIHIFTLIYL